VDPFKGKKEGGKYTKVRAERRERAASNEAGQQASQ
jgi:hypothetical protein